MLQTAKKLSALLIKKGFTVSVAESCTGGMTGAAITAAAGSSEYFKGGVIAYANEIKEKVLCVPKELLETKGAVSGEVVEAMARGVAGLCGSDCAIAVSGIAGPGGGSAEKPIGLVFIGYYVRGKTISEECRFNGDREGIRRQAVEAALAGMSRLLLKLNFLTTTP